MSELDKLADIITVILGKDNQARKQAEALLAQSQTADLNQYILLFGNLLNVTPRKDLRSFCLLHLRRLLSKYANSQGESKWPYLASETQKFLKDLFISILLKEKESAPRNILCDLIGELIATIKTMNKELLDKCSEEGRQWNSITEDIWAFMTSGNTILMECTLKILGVLFDVCPKDFTQNKEQLKTILKQALDHEDLRVKTSAMQALQLYLVNVQTKDCKIFVDLMPTLLADLLIIIDKNEDLGADAMSYFSEIIEKEAKLFKEYIPQIIEALRAIAENNDLTIDTIRENALEGIIVLAEKYPKLTGRQDGLLKNIFQSIFTYMITCVADIDNAWMRPPEGYVQTKDENDSQDFSLKYCMDLFNRLMLQIDEEKTLPTLSVLLKQMIDTNNWKYKYSALMALSQVSAAIVNIKDMDPILEFTINYTKDENPKVRHAAFHCIGQFADDKKFDFQQRYSSTVIPTIVGAFNEQVPRVLAHSLAALTNFLEGSSKKGIEGHIDKILEPCLEFIHTGISIVKENAVGVISALAEAARQDFIRYWEKTAEIVFDVLKNATQKEYKQLRGQCIECLTLLGEAVGKDLFRGAAIEIINAMISIQKTHIEDYDPQKSYLLLGWQRLSALFQQEFAPYLKEILPSLFEIIEKTVRNYERKQKADEAENFGEDADEDEDQEALGKTNTYESEEVALAVKMINTFLSESSSEYLPYIEKTVQLFVFLLEKSRNDNLKIAVAKALPNVVKVLKTSTSSDRGIIIVNTCNTFLSMIWKAYFDDFDVSNMSTYLMAVKQILEEAGRFMDETQLNSFNETLVTCLQDSDQRKRDNQQQIEEEGDNIDEDMFNSLNEENDKEEELQINIAGLIGIVFATHQELALPLAHLISKQMLPMALDTKAPAKMQKFGLILVNNMIEHLGIAHIPNDIPVLSDILIKFLDNDNPEIRETAAYGISVLAEKNREYFQTILGPSVKTLLSAVGTKPRKEENQRAFWRARVQVTIGLGRIIKHYSEHINLKEVVGAWFRNLPLSYFIEECRIQHDMLLDIIDLDPTLIYGEKGQGLANAIQIFSQVLDTRLVNPTFPKRVKKMIETLAANEQTKPMLQAAINDLEGRQQEKLQKLLS